MGVAPEFEWAAESCTPYAEEFMTKKAQPGTVIHGTLREEDLVPAFLDCLEELDKKAADELRANMPKYGTDEMAEFLNEELFNTLNLHAPDGHYFGAHPGDGSDFGFWEDEQGSDWSDLQGFG
jgi:hypothetical protein